MRRLPKIAAALLAAALAVSAALPALAADQRAELELEASVRCTGEAADETLTVRLTALDGAPMPEGCDDEAELDFPARDCRTADDKTLTKTFDAIVYTAPGIYEYTVTQDAGGRKRADYDDTVFYLKVMVAWDTDGELKGHVSVRRDGDDGAKTELLFKNSYRSTDPLPPPVTPPYVPVSRRRPRSRWSSRARSQSSVRRHPRQRCRMKSSRLRSRNRWGLSSRPASCSGPCRCWQAGASPSWRWASG